MVEDAVPDLPGEVQARPGLQAVDDAERLLVVAEAPAEELGQHVLAEMPEGRVAQVVAEADGLDQVLVELEGAGDGPGDLGDLEGVGEADPEVVPFGGQEDLRLVRQAAEGLGVQDAVAVPLEGGPERMRLLGDLPAARVCRADGVGREPGFLSRLDLLPDE